MCNAFSGLITKSGKVYWKAGIDSHDQLQSMFKKQDSELIDDKLPPHNTFARFELVPEDGNYLNIEQEWTFNIDEQVKPKWFTKKYEQPCREAWAKWKKEIYGGIDLESIKHSIHPLKIKPPKKITKAHLRLLSCYISVWGSVGASVRDSVWDSVGNSVWARVRDSVRASVGNSVWDSVRASVGNSVWARVRDSVWASVRDSVRASVWASVWDSVYCYVGSFFPNIKIWKYAPKTKGYPYASCVKLWKMGLVPSFDGTTWRLHGGEKAEILWSGTVEELNIQIKE
jgi:hypothetical protein